ncbi:MAG: glycosyltransferase family 4 protein [Candidatus Omnitrophota bacterium]
MRILIFNWRDLKHPQAGGSEFFLQEQAKIWVQNGHHVTWICSGWKGCFQKKEIVDGIEIIRIGNRVTMYLLAPLKYLLIKRPEVIIDAENGIPFFTPLFAKAKKVLLIYHIHQNVWRKEMIFPFSWCGYFLEMMAMPIVYRNIPIVTISPSSNEDIKRMFCREGKIIYPGIDLKKYFPKEKSGNPEVVFIGRLKRYKSVDILLKTAALLKDELITFYILGSGDEGKSLKEMAGRLQLKKVIFKGFISEKEKIEYLQRAWLVVNPSMVEGWSITNIEANACGTIVIGSNVGGIKDSIIDGDTGLLFPYGDFQILSKKIKNLISDEKGRRVMEKKALLWAQRFSWEESAHRFMEILKRVADIQ